jgi:hypothetical protein
VPRRPAPPTVATSLRKAQADALRRASQFGVGGLVLLGLAVVVSWQETWRVAVPLWGLGSGGVGIALLYGVTVKRARIVQQSFARGCLPVVAVGWTRSPDGCNYGLFPQDADPAVTEPSFVMRLSIIRPTATTSALVAGELRPRQPVGLFTAEGETLAVGRVRSPSRARRVWARRNRKTPWYSASSGREAPPSV